MITNNLSDLTGVATGLTQSPKSKQSRIFQQDGWIAKRQRQPPSSPSDGGNKKNLGLSRVLLIFCCKMPKSGLLAHMPKLCPQKSREANREGNSETSLFRCMFGQDAFGGASAAPETLLSTAVANPLPDSEGRHRDAHHCLPLLSKCLGLAACPPTTRRGSVAEDPAAKLHPPATPCAHCCGNCNGRTATARSADLRPALPRTLDPQ